MEGCGLDDLEWFTRGAGSDLPKDLCSEERWVHLQKTECFAVVQCMSTGLKQWVHWVVYLAVEVSIGHGSAKELGLEAVHGVVHLEVLLDRAKVSWSLPVDMNRADGIWVKKSMLENWTNSSLAEPVIGDGLKWDSGFVPLDQPSPDAVEDWWCDQEGDVLTECLKTSVGLQEPDSVAPDVNVLGSWVTGAFNKAVDEMEPIERAEMTYLSNPAWAKEKHNAQVFVAGKLHNYADEWKKAGADAEVMSWLLNGVPIVVDDKQAELVEQKMDHSFTGIISAMA
jgi:hypothetical protein